MIRICFDKKIKKENRENLVKKFKNSFEEIVIELTCQNKKLDIEIF